MLLSHKLILSIMILMRVYSHHLLTKPTHQLPNALIDTKKGRSHTSLLKMIQHVNINVPERQLTNKFKVCLKHGEPISLKDITFSKRIT